MGRTMRSGPRGSARLWVRRLWAALFLVVLGVYAGPAGAQSTDYATLTQTTVSQLVSALDLYRSDRTAEAQAQLAQA